MTRRTSTKPISNSTTPSSWRARPGNSSTIRRMPRPRPRAARRSSISCAAARASRAFMPRAIRIIGARTQKPGGGGFNFQVIPVVMQMLAGDRNSDGRLSREEFTGLADTWYDKFDVDKTGRISQADFPQRFAALPPAAQPAARGGRQRPGTRHQPRSGHGNRDLARVQQDDRRLLQVPLERQNLRVLTSIDYSKMSAEDKSQGTEPAVRRRLRAQLDPSRGEGPCVLRSARP